MMQIQNLDQNSVEEAYSPDIKGHYSLCVICITSIVDLAINKQRGNFHEKGNTK